jgi:hypothetical protein
MKLLIAGVTYVYEPYVTPPFTLRILHYHTLADARRVAEEHKALFSAIQAES